MDTQSDAVRAAQCDAAEDDEMPLITICRDIPGDHTGGDDCFCSPLTFRADEPIDEIMAAMEAAQTPN